MLKKEKGTKEAEEARKEKERMEVETQQLAMIASTFANDELVSKKATLKQYMDLADRLRDENLKLREEMSDRDKDSLQVVEFLRKEVEKKQEQLDSLQRLLETQREDLNREHRRSEDALQDSIREKDEELERNVVEMKRLEDELQSVAQFKKEKHEMEAELKALTAAHAQLKEKFERELSKLRFHSLEEKVRLKNEEEALRRRNDRDVEDKAYALLDEKTKRIHHQNKELLEDKGRLERESEQARRSREAADDQRKKRERDLELNEQTMNISAKQGHRLNKEIKDLTAKNRNLQTSLTNAVHAYQVEKAKIEGEHEEALQQRDQKLNDAQRMIDTRTKELYRVRALARQIVESRTELEAFFNEALGYVKQQIMEESMKHLPATGRVPRPPRRLPGAGKSVTSKPMRSPEEGKGSMTTFTTTRFEPVLEEGGDGTLRDAQLPPISPGSTMAAAVQNPMTVDVSDLSWEDKERVLRILFAKINNVQARRPRKRNAGPLNPVDTGQHTFLTEQA